LVHDTNEESVIF
jgi:hypothetical protein